MGRTLQTYSKLLLQRQQELGKFRRALRAEDQHAFDTLFEQARKHIQASVYYSDPDPAEAFFLSILIENSKIIDKLQTRMNELEEQLKTLKATYDESAA
jgi:hypothetical protein